LQGQCSGIRAEAKKHGHEKAALPSAASAAITREIGGSYFIAMAFSAFM
jgi:hypothetical protein